VNDSPLVQQLCFEKRCNQALNDLARSRNEPLFLKQRLSDRTDIPAWLVPGRSVC